MALNTAPIFPLTPINSWTAPFTAAVTSIGDIITTTPASLVFTAHATNGSRLDYLRVRALGSNVATVLRVFINNGASAATATNNALFTEVTIAATTLSQVAALAETTIQLDLSLPATYRVYVTIGTTVSAGFVASAIGGDY